MLNIVKNSLVALAIGFIVEIIGRELQSKFLITFLENNLITLQVALLAINSATMGIVLTKIRDLIDKYDSKHSFKNTQKEILLSLQEQIILIAISIALLIVHGSLLIESSNIQTLINSLIIGVFIYELFILYDSAKSVFILVNYNGSEN